MTSTPRPFVLAPLTAHSPATGRQWADRLHISRRRWVRIVARGAVTIDEADQFATAVGLHPCELWGDLWWQHADPETAS